MVDSDDGCDGKFDPDRLVADRGLKYCFQPPAAGDVPPA